MTYHNVISDDLFDDTILHLGVSCSTSAFKRQLDIILSRFEVTTDLGRPGTCIISFDDGYRNNLEIAAHLLHDNGVPGLFFVPACYFEGRKILWVDKLQMWVSYVPAGRYSILGNEFIIEGNTSRRHLWSHLYDRILADYSRLDFLHEELDCICTFATIRTFVPEKLFNLRFIGMDGGDIAMVKSMGHRIGCHSFQHDILSLLNSEQLESDFSRCSLHADIFNSNYYSYPFGGVHEVSPLAINICERYGYFAAFINYEAGSNNSVYAIGRDSLGNLTDKYFIEARLSGFERFLKSLYR